MVSSSQLKDIVPDIRNILEEVVEEEPEPEVESTADIQLPPAKSDDGVESMQVYEEDDDDEAEEKTVPSENGHKNGTGDAEAEADESQSRPEAGTSCVVDIQNLVRPFTSKQLVSML
jgi:hypothetical protein